MVMGPVECRRGADLAAPYVLATTEQDVGIHEPMRRSGRFCRRRARTRPSNRISSSSAQLRRVSERPRRGDAAQCPLQRAHPALHGVATRAKKRSYRSLEVCHCLPAGPHGVRNSCAGGRTIERADHRRRNGDAGRERWNAVEKPPSSRPSRISNESQQTMNKSTSSSFSAYEPRVIVRLRMPDIGGEVISLCRLRKSRDQTF
jgi:hypothetical protein